MTADPDAHGGAVRVGPAGGAAEFCAIVLHGLGADGHDLAPLARQLPALANFRVVLPHAPVRAITVNGGMRMRAWYDITETDIRQRQDAEGIAQSAEMIGAVIDGEIAAGTPPQRLFLAGFSQGGAMSLHVGLRRREPLAGVVSLSGYALLADQLEAELAPHPDKVPVFMAHGTHDPIVPVQAAHEARDLLRGLGVGVEYREYPIDHTISFEEAEALNGWIGRAAAAAGAK